MGLFLGKCCGNAASKIACGRSPNRGNSRHSAKLGEDPVFIARDIKLAPPICANGTNGNKNAYKHGLYSAKAIARRRSISMLIRSARRQCS